MKRLFSSAILILISIFLFLSCGPSAKEMEEKRVADDTRTSDSLAMEQSIAKNLSLNTNTPKDKKFIKTAETKFRVQNVQTASEKIEDLAVHYSGFVVFSNLSNEESEMERFGISKDSVVLTKKIVVRNEMKLKVPNENIDSLVRQLNKMILFLDYRVIQLDEVTFSILANEKATERLRTYDSRQKKNIDSKGAKLKETTNAEDNLLRHQNEADRLQVEKAALEEQVNYCTLTMYLYQKPVIYSETQVLLNKDSFRVNLFTRLKEGSITSWILFEDFLVFLITFWWVVAIITSGFILLGYRRRRKILKE